MLDFVPFRVFRGCLLCLFFFAGCRSAKLPADTTPAATTTTNAPAHPKPVIVWVEVASVNAAQGYVVLRAKGLISTVGEATVWRGTNEVARLRVGGPARPAWLTADILSGHPQPGDRVEIMIVKYQNTVSGGK